MIDGKKEILLFERKDGMNLQINTREISPKVLEYLWKLVRTNDSPFPETRAYILSPKAFKKWRGWNWKFQNRIEKWSLQGRNWDEYHKQFGVCDGVYDGDNNVILIEEPKGLCIEKDIRSFYIQVLFHELNHVNEKINGKNRQPFVSDKELWARVKKNFKLLDNI